MASRFRVLDALDRTAPAPAWRDDPAIHNIVPFSLDAIETPRPGTGKLTAPALVPLDLPRQTGALRHTGSLGPDFGVRHTGYLTGISLSGILQMMHMERNSCLLEVASLGRIGALTLVNGELIDAEVGDETGDAVALRILRWPDPVTAIFPSSSIVRHSVSFPLTQLLMDAVRLDDEALVLPDSAWLDEIVGVDAETPLPSRWRALPDRLVELGAHAALLMTPGRDNPVAEAGEGADRAASTATVARGIRTWATLLVEGVDRVHVIAGSRRLVVATLSPDHDAFIYIEAPADLPLGPIWQAIAAAT